MFRVGLTGGIGMGKSASAAILADLGVPVVDTDDLAREVVAPGEPAWRCIREHYGEGILLADGQLDRAALARRVFGDEGERRRLESWTHPEIRRRWVTRMADWETAGHAVGVVVIPLLFETSAAAELDHVICVACSDGIRRVRMTSRGWSEDEYRRRSGAQWPVTEKMLRSDTVLWNEGDSDLLRRQIVVVLRALTR